MTKKTLTKKNPLKEFDIDFKINHINSILVIFLLLNNILSNSVPISFNPIFLTVYYICNAIIFIILLVLVYYDITWLLIKYGK